MSQVEYFPLVGGIDLTTPPLTVGAGSCLVGVNYEVDLYGGYRRIHGYERYDGQSSPTDTGGIDHAAIETQRALIGAVSGSGPIRGVWVYNEIVYAFRDNTAGTAAAMWKATVTGWVSITIPALAAGGKYRFVNYNFTGSVGTNMMYGCNGFDKAFQFDGTTLTQIATGMATDTPTYITAHKKHLFLSFAGGSVQHSALGDPFSWTPVSGASEIALGDEVTGFEQQAGDALAIFTRNQTHMLHGTSSLDWNLRPISRTVGCIAASNQRLGNTTLYLADRGVTSLNAVQAFGDFVADSVSQQIAPLINILKTNITDSVQVRSKGQYRLFNAAGDGVVATFNGNQLAGWMTLSFPDPVVCAVSGEDSTGNEVVYFGSDNGFVYQMEKGASFDGAAIPATLRLHFNHTNSPRTRKRYRRVLLEQEGASDGTLITYQAEFDGGAYTSGQGSANTATLNAQVSYWNTNPWNSFSWSSNAPSALNASVDGTAKNIGLLIYSNLIYSDPYKLTGALLHYDIRRTDRGD